MTTPRNGGETSDTDGFGGKSSKSILWTDAGVHAIQVNNFVKSLKMDGATKYICGLVPNMVFTVIPYGITCILVRRPLALKHQLPLTLLSRFSAYLP